MQLVKSATTELVSLENGKEVSSKLGRYNDQVTMLLAKKYSGKTVTVRDIARTQYGRVNSYNEQYVRRRIYKSVNALLRSGVPAIAVYEATGFHRVTGIKVIVDYNESDVSELERQASLAVERGELSSEKAALITAAIEQLRPMVQPPLNGIN